MNQANVISLIQCGIKPFLDSWLEWFACLLIILSFT